MARECRRRGTHGSHHPGPPGATRGWRETNEEEARLPLTGDQRPPSPLPPEPAHTPTRHSTPQSHTQHAKPFPPGHPGRCEIPRREATSATWGFPKAATSPELPPSLVNLKGQEGNRTSVSAQRDYVGRSSWLQASSHHHPPRQQGEGLTCAPGASLPPRRSEARKSSEPCVPGVAGDSVSRKKGRVGRFSWRQAAARNKLPRVEIYPEGSHQTSRVHKRGGGYKEKSQPGFHPQGGWGGHTTGNLSLSSSATP